MYFLHRWQHRPKLILTLHCSIIRIHRLVVSRRLAVLLVLDHFNPVVVGVYID